MTTPSDPWTDPWQMAPGFPTLPGTATSPVPEGAPAAAARTAGTSPAPDVPAPAAAAPLPTPRMIWGRGMLGLQAVGVWTERVPGRGEDAEPLIAHHHGSVRGLLGVFDGSGGSGSSPAWQAPGGEQRTGAWVGARVARLATECWFREIVDQGTPADAEVLKDYLDYFHDRAPQRRSKIVGRMRRQLPTTLAAVEYGVREGGTVEVRTLWAGDSRAYVLTPAAGLQVLTSDHTEEHDALALLRSDPPMTNTVCADRDFFIEERSHTFPMPCVLLAATDGFFGYVHTPADFENTLLTTLMRADNAVEWADLIRREVQEYTADDASLCLVALGHRDFAGTRAAFEQRAAFLAELCGKGRPSGADQAATVRSWQNSTWQEYRHGYEAYLPTSQEDTE